jgi:hypothetical protein
VLNYATLHEGVLGMEVYLHAFLTSVLDGGEGSTSRPGRVLSEITAPVPIGYEAGWAPELVWTWQQRQKNPITAPVGK